MPVLPNNAARFPMLGFRVTSIFAVVFRTAGVFDFAFGFNRAQENSNTNTASYKCSAFAFELLHRHEPSAI
jgi:hypothetical protein